ncbi:MAG: redox-sensing transcriptional repressor Rex [Oscillospiraceae bacterium]|nr:redox-sensing transcriptional repressor Rex [Oscillospiraceae bacterium]
MQEKSISKSVIRRLPRYNRFLEELLREGKEKISSRELSERMRLTASQIRQDLNCFGGFGQQGYGYNVAELRAEIGAILKINGDQRRVILIGAGNLGRAIASHINFEKYGFKLIGIFDRDSSAVGEKIADITVYSTEKLKSFCDVNVPEMAILCIPPEGAKETVSELIDCGIGAFWNYSHYDIHGDFPDAVVENVHLSDSLMILSYEMGTKNAEPKPQKKIEV